MKKYVLFLLLSIFTTSIFTAPIFANITASLSNRIIASGQPFQLTISSNTDNKISPDTAPLKKDFIILRQSTGQSIRSVNGHTTKNYQWVYTIQAIPTLKKEDKPIQLVIPSISISNDKTQPLTITLTAPVGSFHYDDSSIQITSNIEKKSYHVQEEIRLKIKIAISPAMSQEIQGAALSPISIPDVTVKELGKPQKTEEIIGSKPFLVTSITYVLFPQKSGLLNIPSQTLAMRVLDRTKKANHHFSQFGFGNSMFQVTTPLRLVTEPHHLNILPIPQSYNAPWIPASGLTLSQTIKKPNTKDGYQTGDIIRRKITITATGLLGTQIPDLMDHFKNENLSNYPEPAIFGTSNNHGKRIETIRYIANKPGTYTFPPINITWWNTKTNKVETTSLSEETITVMGQTIDNKGLAAIKKAPFTEESISDNQTASSIKAMPAKKALSYYIPITILLMVLLLITLFIVLSDRKKRTTPPKQNNIKDTTKITHMASIAPLLKKLTLAFNSRKTQEIHQALRSISKQLYPKKPNAYQLLCNHFSDDNKAYLAAIEHYHYSPSRNITEPYPDKAIIKNIVVTIKSIAQSQDSQQSRVIPNLYPDN